MLDVMDLVLKWTDLEKRRSWNGSKKPPPETAILFLNDAREMKQTFIEQIVLGGNASSYLS